VCESEKSVITCPRCGTPTIRGHLKDPVNAIIVESLCSLKSSNLEARICPACGHVELQATHPEDLARHDISDEEPDSRSEDWKDWRRAARRAHA
jgi:ribosomal protein S27AE